MFANTCPCSSKGFPRPDRHFAASAAPVLVFAAGGFSASPYVLQRLKKELGSSANNAGVLVASNPGAAILRGEAAACLRVGGFVARLQPLQHLWLLALLAAADTVVPAVLPSCQKSMS